VSLLSGGGAEQSIEGDVGMKIWILAVGAFLLAMSQGAGATQTNYTATWDPNSPDEQVERYVLRIFNAGGDLATYETPGTEQAFTLDLPIDSRFSVTVKACREQECSDESPPLDVIVPPDTLTIPGNLRVQVGGGSPP